MKHILDFNDFLNESKNYRSEEEVIVDAFAAFNKKYGTKLSIADFEIENEYNVGGNPSKYYLPGKSAMGEIRKLIKHSDWSGGIGDFDTLEIQVQGGSIFPGSVYSVAFNKRSSGSVKSTQNLTVFPYEFK